MTAQLQYLPVECYQSKKGIACKFQIQEEKAQI
jgi:hypothetical protein